MRSRTVPERRAGKRQFKGTLQIQPQVRRHIERGFELDRGVRRDRLFALQDFVDGLNGATHRRDELSLRHLANLQLLREHLAGMHCHVRFDSADAGVNHRSRLLLNRDVAVGVHAQDQLHLAGQAHRILAFAIAGEG